MDKFLRPVYNFHLHSEQGEINMSQDQIEVQELIKVGPPTKDYSIKRLSFFERLHSITDEDLLQSPLLAMVLPTADFVQFALHYGVESDMALKVAGGYPYAKAIRDGCLQRGWLWLRGFRRIGEPRPIDLKYPVPIGELHAPNVKGVSVTYKLSQSFEGGMKLTVKIAGMGGGGSISGKVTVGLEQDVSGGDCVGLVADVSGFSQEWSNNKTGKTVLTVDITGIASEAFPVDLKNYPVVKKHEHICLEAKKYKTLLRQITAGGLVAGRDYHSVKPEKKGFRPFIEISESRTYKATWNIPGLSDKEFGVQVASRFDHTISATYSLLPGYRYIGVYEDDDLLPLLWLAGK